MRNITVGFCDLQEKSFISSIVITNNFLSLLERYTKVVRIPISREHNLKESFLSEIKKYNLDYLYIDSFYFLLESFLLREKFRLDIPFILKLDTVYSWIKPYVFLIPLIRKYDIIYAPSQYAKDSFLRILDKFKIHIIPNVLDIECIQNNISHCCKSDRKVITFMGRLVEDKGIEILIESMPKIIAKVKDAHLNIIGPLSSVGITDYPKHPYVKRLEDKVRKLKLIPRVHFKGVQLGLDKYRMLSESDVFVNPTVASGETFGIVNLEALVCGVPVITTNWGGSKELIQDRKNGFLINVDEHREGVFKIDTEQMVSVLVNVLEDRQLDLTLRNRALKTARRYDYHKILPRFVNLLRKRGRLKVKNNWNGIKHKRVIDFRYLFNENIFFFIYLTKIFRKETYSSLYSKYIDYTPSKQSSEPKIKKSNNERAKSTIKKIENALLRFLLLQNK